MNSEWLYQSRSLEPSFLQQRSNNTQIINGNSLNHSIILGAINSPYNISSNSMMQQPVQNMPFKFETPASQFPQILLAQNQRTLYHSNNLQNEVSQHSVKRPSAFPINSSGTIFWDTMNKCFSGPIVRQEHPALKNLRYYKKNVISSINLNAKNANNNILPLSINNVNLKNNIALVHKENPVMKNLRDYRKTSTVQLNLKGLNLENVNNNVQPLSVNNISEYRLQYNYNRNANAVPKIHVKDVTSLNNSVATNYQSQFSVYKPVYYQKNVQLTDRKFENISPANSFNVNQCEQRLLSMSSVYVSNNTSKPQEQPPFVSANDSINQFYYSNSIQNFESNFSGNMGQKNEVDQNNVNSPGNIFPTINNNVSIGSNRDEILPSNSHIAYSDNSVYYSSYDNINDNLGTATSGSTLSNFSEKLQNNNNNEASTFSRNSLLRTTSNAVKTTGQSIERGAKDLGNLNFSQTVTDNDTIKNCLDVENAQSTNANTNFEITIEKLSEKSEVITSAENFSNQKDSNSDSEVKFLAEISVAKSHGSPRQIRNKENEQLNWDSSSFKNKINRKKLDLLIEFVECDSFDENFAKSKLDESATEGERENSKENFSNSCYPGVGNFKSLKNQGKENESFKKINEKLNRKNGENSDGALVHLRQESVIINSKRNEPDTTIEAISAKEIVTESDDETDALSQNPFSEEIIEENEISVKTETEELKPLISSEIKEQILKSGPEKYATKLSENGILGSAFEDPDFINKMKTFQKIKFHKCISCNLSLPNSSFWMNIISGELRCLNCFRKMGENSPAKKDRLEKCKERTEVHCVSGSSRKRKRKRKKTQDSKKAKVSEKTLSSVGLDKSNC